MAVAMIESHILGNDCWNTVDFETNVLSLPITMFHFVAHTNVGNDVSDEGADYPTNHWALFLTTGRESSVMIDVLPTNGANMPGKVYLESKAYEVTNHTTCRISLAGHNNITVALVLKVIIDNRSYTFTSAVEGCRFWLFTLASDLGDAEIIDEAVVEEVQDSLGKYWPYPAGKADPIPRPMIEGTFWTDYKQIPRHWMRRA